MSDYQSVGDVLSRLVDEGYIDAIPENPPFNADDDTPIYIKALMGFGGWIAALFFFVFAGWCLVLTLGGINNQVTLGFILCFLGGIMALGTAIVQQQAKGVFVSQVTLALHIAGQLLLMVGINILLYEWLGYNSTINYPTILFSLIIIGIEVILIPLYEDGTFRFLATIAAVIAANTLVYTLNIPATLSILTGLLASGVVITWSDVLPAETQIRYRPILHTVGYGLVFGLFGTIMHELSNNPTVNEYSAHFALYTPLITSLLLLALTLWLEVRLLDNYDIPFSHRSAIVILAITIIVTLPTLTTPGILASILLIVLGYRRRHSILLILAYVFMASFISHYYYSLEVTLLIKSFILMATGVLFLAGGWSFRRFLSVPETKEQ